MPSFPSQGNPLARLQRGGQAHPAGPIKFGRVSEASKLKDRGFGFIAPEDGSENVFFHIHWCVESETSIHNFVALAE